MFLKWIFLGFYTSQDLISIFKVSKFNITFKIPFFSRIPHFHAMHRAMHPWKTTSIPDLGKFLYRQALKHQRNDRSPPKDNLDVHLGSRPASQVVQPDSVLWDEHAPHWGHTLLLSGPHSCCPRPSPGYTSDLQLFFSFIPCFGCLWKYQLTSINWNVLFLGARIGSDHWLCDGCLARPRRLPVAWQWRLLPHAAPQGIYLIIVIIFCVFLLLHHIYLIFKHFDCNYGAMHVPLDWLFGTYAGCKEEVFVFSIRNWIYFCCYAVLLFYCVCSRCRRSGTARSLETRRTRRRWMSSSSSPSSPP